MEKIIIVVSGFLFSSFALKIIDTNINEQSYIMFGNEHATTSLLTLAGSRQRVRNGNGNVAQFVCFQ